MIPIISGLLPLDGMQPWIQDALDLIEFANGASETAWGTVRAQMGHEAPFRLEYIAIGNEEVGMPSLNDIPCSIKPSGENIRR